MSEDLSVISSQLNAIKSEVVEFNVGVSHLALDEERERYTRIRERIESLVIVLGNNKSDAGKLELENARRLLRVATGNTETLRYLETISCLENIFTDVAKAATVTAVGLSTEDGISQRALSSRFLTDNVKQCWDYTTQLSNLAAIQLKAAADFHIFNHEVNEVRAHASQLKNLSGKQLEAFSPDGRIDEASNLATEMKERLSAFQSLSERARTLASKAPSILPVENRLLKVRNGVVGSSELGGQLMAQLLIDYVGGNFTAKKGESLPLIDTTENPYLWKVMTPNGPQYIPSIACIIASANGEQIHDAYKTLSTVKDAWNDSVENYRRQLAIYYSKYLEGVGQRGGLHTTDPTGKRRFLEDLDRLLIQADADEGRLANTLAMLSGKAVSRPEQANEVWSRSELNLLHQPLLILNEHVQSLKRMDENVDLYTNRMREYASSITSEARGLQAQLESLRLTHDRNRAELKELYDRVHNWKTAYTESLNGPTTGVGRLIISSVSSSSGISSEELPPIPIPPSPFGRITPVELPITQGEDSDVEFLETRDHRRSKMNVALLQAKDTSRSEKATVFTCGANLHPRQIYGSLNVNQTSAPKPKAVRDSQTQTIHRRVIQNTQTELTGNLVDCKLIATQSEPNRVDCMTQIGWIKAQKAQQVDVSIISAAMEGATSEDTTAYCEIATPHVKKQDLILQIGDSRALTGPESGTPNRKSGAYETDTHSIDSGAIEAHIAKGRLNFETRKESRDIITQVHSVSEASNFGSRRDLGYRKMETAKTKDQPKQKESEIQAGPSGLKTSSVELARAFSSTNLQTKIDRNSVKMETTLRPLKSHDAEPQISQAYDGMKGRKYASQQNLVDGGFKELTKDTSYCELNANGLTSSDIDLQVSKPALVETAVVNGMGKSKIFVECTCVDKVPRGMKGVENFSSNHFCALHQPISFHFTPPCYAQCETPLRMQETSSFYIKRTIDCQTESPKLVPREAEVSTVGARIGTGDLTKENIPTEETRKGMQKPTAPEAGVVEFTTTGPEMNVRSVSFPKRTADRSTTAPRTAAGAEAQTAVNKLQHGVLEHSSNSPPSEPTYLATCATKRVCREVPCQVGTILQPETMEISTVPLKLAEIGQFSHQDGTFNAVICPTRVLVKPVLTEDAGINVAKMRDMHHLNVKIGDRMYDASVAQTSGMQTQQETDHDKRQICTLEMNSKNGQMDNYTMTASPSVTEAGITITLNGQRRQQQTVNQLPVCPSCHCQLETSYMSSAITEASTSRRRRPAVSKTTQVGTILTPTRVQVVGVGTKSKTQPEISKFSGGVQNIVCPSTVELVSSLTETGGIKVKDLSEVNAINILAEGSTLHANVQNQVCQGNVAHSKGDPAHNRTATTAKKSEIRSISSQPLMQQVRFEIVSTKISEPCDFCHGTGQKVSAQVSSQDLKATSTTSATYQQLVNQKIQGPEVSSVECQVGAILRPTRVHIANVEIRPRTAELARQMGMTPNAIICPSTIELQTELAENGGIQVMNSKDVRSMELVAGTSIFETSFCESATNERRRSIPSRKPFMDNMNITCGKSGLTLGQAQTEEVVLKTVPNAETFTLHDVGCEFAIKSVNVGTVCNQCHGRGRIGSSQTALPPIRGTSVDYRRKHSFIHQRASTPVSRAVGCQVGTVLRPSTIEVGNICVKPRDRKVAEYLGMNVDSVLCPARVQMIPEIREAPGIEIVNVTDVACTEIQAGEIVVDADVQTHKPRWPSVATGTEKKPRLLLNIKSNGNGLTIGHSSSHASKQDIAAVCDTFTLNDIGCEVVLRNSSIGGVCASCKGSGRTASLSARAMPKVLETQGVETSHQYSRLVPALMMTKPVSSVTKSCQVGTVLTPTCVNVAGVEMYPKNTMSVISSGTIVYPAAIEVESKLVETSGIHIREVATMDSVNFSLGEKPYIASTEKTSKSKVEPCVLEVRSFHPEAVRGELSTHPMAVGSHVSSGQFHLQSIGCEFRLSDVTATTPKYPYRLADNSESKTLVGKGLISTTVPKKTDASCQVGLTLVPRKMNVSTVKVAVEDRSSANIMGISGPSVLQPTTCELESRISEKSGIAIAQIDAVEQLQLQIGGEIYNASVVGGSVKPKKIETTGSWGSKHSPISITGHPRPVINVPSSIQWLEAGLCNTTGPYLVTMKESTVQKKSILEVGALTLDERRLQLTVDGDLRGKLTMQTTPQPSSSGQRPTSHPASSQRRPDSRLCDVACEALIKPETLEKRLQTVLI